MANYDTLKATIDAYIRANGVKAITGPVLNGVLRAMVDSLGNGFLFAGEALPNGDPGTPDQNVVRYATQAGTYTNYGGYVHDGKHLVWFVWHGSWNAYPTQVPTDSSLPARVSQLANDAGYITADALAAFYTKVETDALLAGKQATLESGTNIKTINGESILGSGNITIQGGGSEPYFIRGTIDFNQNPPAVTITSGTYAEALAAYNAGTPVYAALTEGNGAVNIYPLAQVISPFLVFLGIGADSVLAVGLESDGTVTTANSALVHPSDLAPVATSGNYNDLTNKPTIPAAQVQSDWDEADNTEPSFIRNKPTLGKMGVISQTQTWTQAADGGYNYTMSDPVRGLIPQANIDLFESAGAVFNATTGYFELNGLTDISYEEMQVIYGHPIRNASDLINEAIFPVKQRTTLPLSRWGASQSINSSCAFANGSMLEVVNLSTFHNYPLRFTAYASFFVGCNWLREVIGPIRIIGGMATTAIFTNCYSLETVYQSHIERNTSFAQSPLLSLASVVYMVQNAANTSAITITLHATAYARCQADTTEYTYQGNTYTGILALATAHNISIGQA